MARFRALDLRVEAKPDLTPVSDADTAVEKALRAHPGRAPGPRDGVLGEEFGAQPAAGPDSRRWVIDPIDGTKNFVRGVPIWATLIALMEGDRAGRRPGLRAGAGPALVGARRARARTPGRHTARRARRSGSPGCAGSPTPASATRR